MAIDDILGKISWREASNNLGAGVKQSLNGELKLIADTKLNRTILERIITQGITYADSFLHGLARDTSYLTGNERFELLGEMSGTFEYAIYNAACDVPDLTREQRWELVQKLKSDEHISLAAINVPGLTTEQRIELYHRIENPKNKSEVALNAPGFTPDKIYELADDIQDEGYRNFVLKQLNALYLKHLTPANQAELTQRIEDINLKYSSIR